MYRISSFHLPLIVAASIWSMPVLALDQRNAIAGSFCDSGGYLDYRAPGVQHVQGPSAQAACNDLVGAGGIIGLYPLRADTGMTLLVADEGTPRPYSGGLTAGVGKGAEISLLQSIPVRIPGTPQGGKDAQTEQWVWPSDSPIPEPGLWVVLIAGFLAMCAVARRRFLVS